MEYLIILVLVLIAVTVIGHGIWVLVARLFGSRSGQPATSRRFTRDAWRSCPNCDDLMHRSASRCPGCGLARSVTRELADLKGTLRQLEAIRGKGLLLQADFERLCNFVEGRRRAILTGRAKPKLDDVNESLPENALAPAHAIEKLIQPTAPLEEEILEVLPGTPGLVPHVAGIRSQVVEDPEQAVTVVRAVEIPPKQPEATPRTPRRTLAEWMAAFMEERNILVGELMGGLLMVGCTIALVIYFWKTLEESLPYYPFLILATMTASLFGIGHYTYHHWKLTSTSRGLLVIATLLVPLNFIVLAKISKGEEGGYLEIGTKILAVAVFSWLVSRAAKILLVRTDAGPLLHKPIYQSETVLLPLAVVVASACQLPVQRLLTSADSGIWFVILGAWAVSGYALAVGGALWGRVQAPSFDREDGATLLGFLGLSSFAMVMSLGFLGFWMGSRGEIQAFQIALERMSLLVALAGIPALAVGLYLRHAMRAAEAGSTSSHLLLAGTGTALAGMLVLLAGIFLAWPNPALLISVCALDFVVLTAAALLFRLPMAHALAMFCLAAGYLAAYHLAAGNLDVPREDMAGKLLELTYSGSSGLALAALVALFIAIAEGLTFKGLCDHAIFYRMGSCAISLPAMFLVTRLGILESDQALAPWVFGGFAVAAMILSKRWQWAWLDHAGAILVLYTTLWSVNWGKPGQYRVWSAALIAQALLFSILEAGWLMETLLAIGLAFGLMLFPPQVFHAGWYTLSAGLLSATAFVQAGRRRLPILTWIGSVLVLVCLGHGLLVRYTSLDIPVPLLMVLLAHATLVQTAGLLARLWKSASGSFPALPLGQSALVTLTLAVPVLFLRVDPDQMAVRSGYCLWLAGLWLAQAVFEKRTWLFPAFQAGLSVAMLFAVAAWLVPQDWVVDQYPVGLLDPRSFQAFGFGLTALTLLWGCIRLIKPRHPMIQELLGAVNPSVDRVLLGVLVIGQLLVAVVTITPGILHEMVSSNIEFASWLEISRDHAAGAWYLLGSLTLVVFVWLLEARTATRQVLILVSLLLLAVTVPLLAALPFDSQAATASALRWGLSLGFVAVSAALWLRQPVSRQATRWGIFAEVPEGANLVRALLVALTALPVVGLTVWMAVAVFSGEHAGGPDPTSFFARIGPFWSHLVPLAIVLIGLTGHALRERSEGFAFAGGMIVNLIAMGGYALAVVEAGLSMEAHRWVCLLQCGTIASAVWALAWLAVVHRFAPRPVVNGAELPARFRSPLLAVQACLGASGAAVLTLLPLPRLISYPGVVPSELMGQIGNWQGCLALGLAFMAGFDYLRREVSLRSRHLWSGLTLALGVLAACSLAPWDNGNWLVYHTLMTTWTLAAWGILLVRIPFTPNTSPQKEEWAKTVLALSPWVQVLGGLVVALAVRVAWSDPWRPYVPGGAVLAISVLVGCLAMIGRRQAEVIAAGLLLDLACLLVWISSGPDTPHSFISVNALGLALASTIWSIVELAIRFSKAKLGEDEPSPFVLDFTKPFRHWAALAGASLVAFQVVVGLGSLIGFGILPAAGTLVWIALLTAAVAVVLCQWDVKALFPLPVLYNLGLTAIALVLQGLGWERAELVWLAALLLAGYILATAGLGWLVPRLASWRISLRLPPPTLPWFWFAPTQTTVASLALFLSALVALSDPSPWHRLLGPLTVTLLIPAAAMMTARTAGSWQRQLANTTLALGVFLLVELGWAAFDSSATGLFLHRWVALLNALALATILYSFVVPRLLFVGNDWSVRSRQAGPLLGLMACGVIAIVVLMEGLAFDRTTMHTPLLWLEIAGVLVALVGLITAGICFALAPWADPFGLSEIRRRYYVYAAEILLVFLFLHLRFNVPEIFPRIIGIYWTFAVMAVAFLGVGLGEFFRSRKLDVLSEPLQRTGMFLPLLPLLAFWLRPPQIVQDQLIPNYFGTYSLLWFASGLLYAWLAVTRRSFRYGLVASLAANVGLWSLWGQQGWAFLVHPQLWLIPLAIIILVSEVINRPHLSNELSTGLRYLGLGMLYLSSTADLFITGLGQSVWLPLWLALLSVLGVLVGILLRVRSYLYLGVGFLALDIFSMIWLAAVDLHQVWVWWVSGIVLGAAILALFALFEKRRLHLQRVFEEFRGWR